jgi:hypothetical protein
MASYTPEQLAMLQAQVEHFASAEHVCREVDAWRDSTPEERLAELDRMCEVADQILAELPPEQLERALAREPLSDESIRLLAALRNLR